MRTLSIALAGNSNVGKSALFNQLTGLRQNVGNWPGTTVEKVEGALYFQGFKIKVVDLPGVYSLSAFSADERVAREYIASGEPDVVIDVVDATALERNLYLTLQLLELSAPMVVALNQVDAAARKGLVIDVEALSRELGVPVAPTVAITGQGVKELLALAVKAAQEKVRPPSPKYGREVEERVARLALEVERRSEQLGLRYPARWVALKLLERDEEITKLLLSRPQGRELVMLAEALAEELEEIHGEPSPMVIAAERYNVAARIARLCVKAVAPPKPSLTDRLDSLLMHRVLGYPILAGVLVSVFAFIFHVGSLLASPLEALFSDFVAPAVRSTLSATLPEAGVDLVVNGVVMGVAAGTTVILPFILPFYLALAILEDSGYLPRAAFLTDTLMHKLGLHGRAVVPMVLGYGCNVPAVMACRVLETERERLIAGLLVVLIPCAARTVVILGLVGRFIGVHAALALYLLDLAVVVLLGRAAFKLLPGEALGLIMEIPPYRVPSPKSVLTKTLTRTWSFIYIAFPLIVGGSVAIEGLRLTGLLELFVEASKPFMEGLLGLPAMCAVPIVFGVLRKELTLIMLAEVAGTTNLASVLTAHQMLVFTAVVMLYVPCVATIASLVHEFGAKRALYMTLLYVGLALAAGALLNFTLALLGI